MSRRFWTARRSITGIFGDSFGPPGGHLLRYTRGCSSFAVAGPACWRSSLHAGCAPAAAAPPHPVLPVQRDRTQTNALLHTRHSQGFLGPSSLEARARRLEDRSECRDRHCCRLRFRKGWANRSANHSRTDLNHRRPNLNENLNECPVSDGRRGPHASSSLPRGRKGAVVDSFSAPKGAAADGRF